jgi:O-antigen/teichoic acid export membrane protein
MKVVRNFSYLTIGRVLSMVFGIFTTMKIAKVLAPESFGLFSFLLVQEQLLLNISDLGMRNVIIRTISRDSNQTKDIFVNGVILKLIVSVLMSIIYIIYNSISGALTTEQLALLITVSFFDCVVSLIESIFFGYENMLNPSIINLAFRIIWFIIIIFIFNSSMSVTTLFSLYVVLIIMKLMVSSYFMVRLKLLNGRIIRFSESAKTLISQSWPYFSLILIQLPINYISNNFLEINSSKSEIAYFNLSNQLIGPVNMIMTFALASIFPNIAKLWTNDKNRFNRVISNGFNAFMMISLFLCISFTLFAKEIIQVLFSNTYLPAVKVCQLQVWYTFLMSINSLIGTIWGATNNEKLFFKAGIINAAISTPLLYFGSKYGAIGLSYAYVGSFALFEFYLWYVFKKSKTVTIKKDWLLWSIAIVAFIVFYFLMGTVPLIYRSLSFLLIITLGYLFARKLREVFKHESDNEILIRKVNNTRME